MGFLSRIFGAKKTGLPSNGSTSKSDKDNKKKRWSFAKHSIRNKSLPLPPPPSAVTHLHPSNTLDANKHAIAVAAATAAVAEAALAAAHAAAEVVRLTSSGGSSTRSRRAAHVGQPRLSVETAVVKIQSAFRRYLARRALRALKALVKLQALLRGHIVRKQTADMLRRMQTMVRLQALARASRAHLSDNVQSYNSSRYPVQEEYEHPLRAYGTKLDGSSILKRCSSNANVRNRESERTRFGSKWLDHWMEENGLNKTRDDEKSDKNLEVDTWKPQFNSHHTPNHYLSSNNNNNNESPSKRSTKGVPTSSSMKLTSRTADNSPQALSASYRIGNGARRGPLTPTGSECSWGYFSGYSGYPNYMANTESFNAKVRSQSVPRQRVEFDTYGSSRKAFQGVWEVGPNSDWDSDSKSKVSPSASSRLNRIGSTYVR